MGNGGGEQEERHEKEAKSSGVRSSGRKRGGDGLMKVLFS
jgi:hypothetical protein